MLINAIEAKHYQKTLLNQTNFSQALQDASILPPMVAELMVKDEYTFDFLNLSEPFRSCWCFSPATYKEAYIRVFYM